MARPHLPAGLGAACLQGVIHSITTSEKGSTKEVSITTFRWFLKNYQFVLAFRFAIEEINESPHLLPNLSLGFDLYDAIPSYHKTLESVLLWVSGRNQTLLNYNCQRQTKSVAIIAGTESAFSAEIGTLLELYKTLQVTYGPFDPILSDKDQFPSLYQMAFKDSSSRVHGVIRLLLHFGWTWYPNNERSLYLPKVVTFLAFEDSLGMALACTALCFSVITAVVLWVFVKHRNTRIVKANNRVLSYVLLLSLLLCFLCSLLFIGHPNTATCILQITFGVVFTVAVSTVLAKTITVILAFKAMKPGRTMRWLLVSGASNSVVPICSLIQVIICGICLGTSPPFIDIDTRSEPKNLIIQCNKGPVTAFYRVLGYLGSLAMGTFSLAYLARNLPDTFNEIKFLTFSMLVFCSVWVTFLPVYHSTKGKAMVAVEIFSILTSSVGLLGCIFAPKCYIILIKPDKNVLKGLRDTIDSR
ncbi:LOW QUALITY PROTEIN: vomeronasal type-2 receptor 116-like [Trichechus inunguis]